jgi:ribose/xylose/arabinose/galactoside ABC-type transport system permease subunit
MINGGRAGSSLLTLGSKQFKHLLVDYGLYVVFAAIVIFFTIRNPKFLALNNIITIVQMSSTLGIVVVGMFFVLIGSGIDISVASNMYFCATVSAVLLNTYHFSIFWCFLISVICGCFVGVINGVFVSRFRLVPFIVTLATMSIVRGFGLIVSGQQLIVLDESVLVVSNTRIFGVPLVAYIFIGTALVGHILLVYTQFGRQLFACGNNYNGAVKIGINGPRIIFLSYLICGICAGLAGMVNVCNLSSISQNFALGDEFVVISSTVVGGASLFGGKGRILPGAFLGIIMIQVILNGLTLAEASPFLYQIIRGVLIFIAVMMDSIKFSGELR